MILFKKDWAKHPNAIPDTKTRNPSFIEICSKYKAMGIEHYYMPLALLDPTLQGVDPFDEEGLTDDLKERITLEILSNPWYVVREIVTDIKAGREFKHSHFKANRGNIAVLWLSFNSIDHFLQQIRQTGKSYISGVTEWMMLDLYCDNVTYNIIVKGEKLRKETVNRIKTIREGIPRWLLENLTSNKDILNTHSIGNHKKSNVIYVSTSNADPIASFSLGRGMSSPFLDIDEVPTIDNLLETLSGASGAGNELRSIHHRAGLPYYTRYTTTAGNRRTKSGAAAYAIWYKGANFTEKFFDCKNRKHLLNVIFKSMKKKSLSPLVTATFNHTQLGKTDEWLYINMEKAEAEYGNKAMAEMDYLNIWGNADKSILLDPETISKVMASIQDPIDTVITKEDCLYRVYEDLSQGVHILGLDTSKASGNDDISFVGINLETGCTSIVGRYNFILIDDVIQVIIGILLQYPNIILVPENKFNGQNFIDSIIIAMVKHNIDPFRRIYNSVVENKEHKETIYREVFSYKVESRSLAIYDRHKDKFGVVTNETIRKSIYGTIIFKALRNNARTIKDQDLANQLSNLVKDERGRVDHTSSMGDDIVIAYLLAYRFLLEARYVREYHIDPSSILSRIPQASSKDASEVQEDIIQEHYLHQKQIKTTRILDKITEPSEESNYVEKLIKQNKYTHIENQLPEIEDKESISKDSQYENLIKKKKTPNKKKDFFDMFKHL